MPERSAAIGMDESRQHDDGRRLAVTRCRVEAHAAVEQRGVGSRSSRNSDNNSYDGNPFLDVATPEAVRDIHSTSTGPNDADYDASHTAEWQAMAPGGSAVIGSAGNGAKSGDVPGGNGIYRAGDTCLFTGFLSG